MARRSFMVAVMLLFAISVYAGGEVKLNVLAKYLDKDCTFQLKGDIEGPYKWSSSNTAVAVVDTNGKVKAVAPGTAIITAVTSDSSRGEAKIYVYGKGTLSNLAFPAIKSSHSNNGLDIAVDKNGILYLAKNTYDEKLAADTKAKAMIWKYDGTWAEYGQNPLGITDDEASTPSIAIGVKGSIYISSLYYKDFNDLYEKNIVYSAGDKVQILGSGKGRLMMVDGDGLYGKNVLAWEGDLFAATVKSGNGTVHKFDQKTSRWTLVGRKIVQDDNFWAGGIDLAVEKGVPYVSIRTSSGTGKIGIYYFDSINKAWKLVGNSYATPENHDAQFQDQVVGESPIVVTENGNILTAYRCYEDGENRIKVRMCAGVNGSWETIFSAPNKTDAIQVGLQKAGSFVYLIIAGYNMGMDIYKLNTCGKWVYEGRTEKIDTYYNFTTAAGPNGEFYMAYDCRDMKDLLSGVFKYTPYQFK